jgi:hypothetical protein
MWGGAPLPASLAKDCKGKKRRPSQLVFDFHVVEDKDEIFSECEVPFPVGAGAGKHRPFWSGHVDGRQKGQG